ncbi:MAG: hypothetical protein JO015_08550 [Verrucomicrobia bacterium]|nr:hypothetical protein [Verrucomicrobiota bacterium]
MPDTLTLLLTHQKAPQIRRMLNHWREFVPVEDILIAYGGPPPEFRHLDHDQRILIDSPRLKTRDHQRQKQSYQDLFHAAREWLRGKDYRFVHFVEYDQVPVQKDFVSLHLAFIQTEACDVAGFHVVRVDGTSNPHFLNHAFDPRFANFWREITVRENGSVVLSMLGTGSFWRRDAFDAVAGLRDTPPVYLELFIPTAAHHLGFRVRGMVRQQRFIQNAGELQSRMGELQAAGAWSVHPVKTLWDE